jgi:L-threonylcarbamoyladenylate synthase
MDVMAEGDVTAPGCLIVDAHGDPPPAGAILKATEALGGGAVIGVPTETVYGLAVDPWKPGAAERLFAVKARPRNVELPVFVAGVDQALALVEGLAESARRLMEAFWPGPLTVVVRRRRGLGADLGDNVDTIGLRCPAHPVPLAICAAYGPYATTSANTHGSAPFQSATDLASELAGVDVVLDAGFCAGEPSSVVEVLGDELRLLRAGPLDWECIVQAAAGVRRTR